jgi:glycosyltransferase involved in cell wall biosynthesis
VSEDRTRPRVLILGTFTSSIGVASPCEEFAAQLGGAGCRVATASSAAKPAARVAGLLAAAVWWRRWADAAIVDVYSSRLFGIAEAACRILGGGPARILVLRGGALPDRAARQPRRVRRLLQRAEHVISPSRYLHDRLRPHVGGDVAIDVIPNPLPIDTFPFRPRPALAPRLVWVRAFSDFYRPRAAVEVLAGLRRDFPDATLTMVGPDKGDGSFGATQARARELGVADAVTFTGPVSREAVAVHLDAADIFLVTTSIDNTPVSVMEAMARGLPVVSTNAGGLPFLLEEGRFGRLCAVDDVPAMVSAIAGLLRDPAGAADLARGARAKAEEFAWSAVLPRWLGLLDAAVTGRLGR